MVLVINGGIYVYVWEGNFFEENLSFWFYQLFFLVFLLNVIFLGVNISVIYVNEIDLKLFQKINLWLKRCIFVGIIFVLEYCEFFDEIFLLVKYFIIY